MKRTNGRILERLLDPISSSLNEEAARKLIGLRADAKARAHVNNLARKCNEDKLTAAERAEYEACVIAGDVIAILQAQARLRLGQKGVAGKRLIGGRASYNGRQITPVESPPPADSCWHTFSDR